MLELDIKYTILEEHSENKWTNIPEMNNRGFFKTREEALNYLVTNVDIEDRVFKIQEYIFG